MTIAFGSLSGRPIVYLSPYLFQHLLLPCILNPTWTLGSATIRVHSRFVAFRRLQFLGLFLLTFASTSSSHRLLVLPTHLTPSFQPVSYTHLDVYKRQVHPARREWIPGVFHRSQELLDLFGRLEDRPDAPLTQQPADAISHATDVEMCIRDR